MLKELLFSIKKSDFEIQPYISSGNGGQNRNKRETAIRLIHKESGIMTTCSDEREQHKNLVKAFKNLTNKPEFKKWLKWKISSLSTEYIKIEEQVDKDMDEKNIKVETYTP